MSDAATLSKASGLFFFIGFVCSKIQYLPKVMFASIFNFISLGFYLLAHLFWYVGTFLYPDQDHEKEWFGLAQFKEQFRLAALIGIVASILSMLAFLLPILIVPAAWLYLIGNVVWSLGEYHKLNNPPSYDENYSQTQQSAYATYSLSITLMTLVGAISTTLIFIFPPITLSILIVSGLFTLGLGGIATEKWLEFTFGDHEKKINKAKEEGDPNDSYALMQKELNRQNACEQTNPINPQTSLPLFAVKETKAAELCENKKTNFSCNFTS